MAADRPGKGLNRAAGMAARFYLLTEKAQTTKNRKEHE
jgi:hypothetical protein